MIDQRPGERAQAYYAQADAYAVDHLALAVGGLVAVIRIEATEIFVGVEGLVPTQQREREPMQHLQLDGLQARADLPTQADLLDGGVNRDERLCAQRAWNQQLQPR